MNTRVCLLAPSRKTQQRYFCLQITQACIASLLCFQLRLANVPMQIAFLLSVVLLGLLSWFGKYKSAEKKILSGGLRRLGSRLASSRMDGSALSKGSHAFLADFLSPSLLVSLCPFYL
jgi:hypothetical protein